jgi:hypothetical protein
LKNEGTRTTKQKYRNRDTTTTKRRKLLPEEPALTISSNGTSLNEPGLALGLSLLVRDRSKPASGDVSFMPSFKATNPFSPALYRVQAAFSDRTPSSAIKKITSQVPSVRTRPSYRTSDDLYHQHQSIAYGRPKGKSNDSLFGAFYSLFNLLPYSRPRSSVSPVTANCDLGHVLEGLSQFCTLPTRSLAQLPP